MKSNNNESAVKERLILCGLSELEERGAQEFSLRRVAAAAEVSCAAPYRHFKDKDELILAIVEYVKDGWFLLASQIRDVHSENPAECVAELCSAMLRFFIGNGSFRTVFIQILTDKKGTNKVALAEFELPIRKAIDEYYDNRGQSSNDAKDDSVYTILSMLYGALLIAGYGRIEQSEQLCRLKESVLSTLAD